jgi:hypothetical protein
MFTTIYPKFTNIFKLFIPPIISFKVLRFLLEKTLSKFKKNEIIFVKDFYTRHAFINKAISNFYKCKYLEIGVSRNDVFNTIPLRISHKYGVDPVSGGNFRMTSDKFFSSFPKLKFDVIFIDGLHTYSQCKKDLLNSIRCLSKNGIIFIHDLIPRNFLEEKPYSFVSSGGAWTGDVWKVAIELTNSRNCEFKIINIDHGIGCLKIKKNFKYKHIPQLSTMNFKHFLKYYPKLPLINPIEALKFLS